MRYQRFRLQIVPGPAEGFSLQASSPRGEGRSPFVFPFDADEWEELRSALRRIARLGRHLSIDHPGEPESSPEVLGERLFEALFQGEILRLYERSVDLLEADPEAGLRIELVVDPRDPALAPFLAVPWELMRPPKSPEILALSRRRSIVRSLAVPRAVYTPRPHSTFRVLLVAPDPRDLAPLDLEGEIRNLQETIGSTAHLEVVQPATPTFAALRQACFEREFQVLHFMGHGRAAPDRAEGVLFFEAEDGSADPVRGMDLVNKLADFPTLRLVVLNACDSASSPFLEDDPMAGVATSLVLGGMPAVVAMQLPISDWAAITFSRAFYQRLAAGDPVDAAVVEGRQAVHSAAPSGIEWAVPVLFLRGQDTAPGPPIQRRWIRWAAAVLLSLLLMAGLGLAGRAWRKERIVAQGAAFFEHGEWSAARERFQAALRLAPTSAEMVSNLAATEERIGDVRAAEEHYREAVRLSSGSAEHLFNVGQFLNSRRRYDEAYPFLLQAVESDPARADAYAELARAALGLEMPGRARVVLAAGLGIDPERPALHRLSGELELKAGHPRAALAHLIEARRRYSQGELGRVETTWLLAQAYERLGDSTAACREIQELRRLDEPGITPWALEAEAGAARLHCSSSGGTQD